MTQMGLDAENFDFPATKHHHPMTIVSVSGNTQIPLHVVFIAVFRGQIDKGHVLAHGQVVADKDGQFSWGAAINQIPCDTQLSASAVSNGNGSQVNLNGSTTVHC